MRKIVIIGNGISGITAARHIRKRSEDEILVISRETEYFYSRTALMYIYMGHMKYEHTKPYENWFWKKNRIQLLKAEVSSIDFGEKSIMVRVHTSNKSSKEPEAIPYDVLILATGSTINKFGWPGQDLAGVQGLYSMQDLQKLESISRSIDHGVIVGGGLIGIELAEMLHSRQKKVTILVREKNYWDNVLPKEEAKMVEEQIRRNNITLHLDTELKEIIDDGQGRAQAIRTSNNTVIECQFVGLTAGVHPNIQWIGKNTPLNMNKGILVDEFLRTNIEDVYAIGDCAELKNPPPTRKPIEAVWYVGRIMGETIAHTITGNPTRYRPGPWFNSAKFINLEYQVYGEVPNKITPPYDSFFWKNKSGHAALRMVYDQNTEQLLGVNVLGIRWRMEVCNKWITSGISVKEAINQIAKANFDPEFEKQNYPAIQRAFQTHLSVKTMQT